MGPIDLAHSALSEQLDDFIRPNAHTGSECHQSERSIVPRRSTRRIQRLQATDVVIRQARAWVYVIPRSDLPAIALEVLDDVPAVTEVVHDVAKVARMCKAERVTDFVKTGQVDDTVAKQGIAERAARDR